MSYQILVPLDGSPQSETVLPFVRLFASKTNVKLELLRCYDSPATVYGIPQPLLPDDHPLGDEKLRDLMMGYLDDRQSELKQIESTISVVCGEPASHIIERGAGADLVIMSSLGRGGPGRWRLGSVTMRVARFCLKPVIVVAGPSPQTPRLEAIMIALDGSIFAERALSAGSDLANSLGARLILYRALALNPGVGGPEAEHQEAEAYLESVKGNLSGPVTTIVDKGQVDIVGRAEDLAVDLVVMGSHGLRDVARRVMGSVAENVLHQGRLPVMVVH